MAVVISRFEVWLVSLDPTRGSEIAKTRPCVVISPDSVNKYLNTVIIAPLTSAHKPYPTRVDCQFDGRVGQIALDQERSVDKSRLVKKLGRLDEAANQQICATLVEMFTY
ncbi:type II toxin-antitoxin system PemK/MazF family toxin [Spirosoma sp. KCTC 42546]|uniref:type II toxin-antitoxin system PemK/MazF family toxin n=1 Tax=Spirosoma sp. KCTC 42546 TaxID=2520506 RepID=UPI001159B701|nr:type II toxin-antitoxin system PemK/MazF family toxin [Spirosoma sp. KCTC 42546]QDK82446.1 type II toxin-antitoxin system PemK/MazF family toxin [Spirosoma sp. KCTC 42546]